MEAAAGHAQERYGLEFGGSAINPLPLHWCLARVLFRGQCAHNHHSSTRCPSSVVDGKTGISQQSRSLAAGQPLSLVCCVRHQTLVSIPLKPSLSWNPGCYRTAFRVSCVSSRAAALNISDMQKLKCRKFTPNKRAATLTSNRFSNTTSITAVLPTPYFSTSQQAA